METQPIVVGLNGSFDLTAAAQKLSEYPEYETLVDTLRRLEGAVSARFDLIAAQEAMDATAANVEIDDEHLGIKVAYIGALDRGLENPERLIAEGKRLILGQGRHLWSPEYAPIRKTIRSAGV